LAVLDKIYESREAELLAKDAELHEQLVTRGTEHIEMTRDF